MEGFVQFAQKAVKAVSDTLPFPISLSDEHGYIIGDTNASRIGTLHNPSMEVIKANEVITFTEEKAIGMENVLPGVAVPLNFDNKPVGVLGIIGNPNEVESYAYLVKKYVEIMWQETIRVQIENLDAMTLESFVQYVLLNKTVDQDQLNHYCQLLDVDSSSNRACIVVDIGNFLLENVQAKQKAFLPEQLKRTLLDCVVRAFDESLNNICAFLNTKRIVLMKSFGNETGFVQFMDEFTNRSEHLQKMFEIYSIEEMTISSGNMCSSIENVNESYQEADFLIKFGQEHSITPQIYTYYSWDILHKMLPYSIDENMQKILDQRINTLVNNDDFLELADNFVTYCNHNMNISKAAKALYIHRNTLIYRLKKIDRIAELDTSSFEHCIVLYFVLKMYL